MSSLSKRVYEEEQICEGTFEDVHEKKRHKCDQCEKDFASRSALRNHKLTKHEGKKRKINKKQCPHCKKSFRQAITINICSHMSRWNRFCVRFARAMRRSGWAISSDTLIRFTSSAAGFVWWMAATTSVANHAQKWWTNHLKKITTSQATLSITWNNVAQQQHHRHWHLFEANCHQRHEQQRSSRSINITATTINTKFTVKFEDIDTYPKIAIFDESIRIDCNFNIIRQ